MWSSTQAASHASARAYLKDETLHIDVRDDGIGGADPQGQGLLGLADRATTLGGRLTIHGPRGGGTVLVATFPLSSAPAPA